MSLLSVLLFSVYRSYTTLIKLITKYSVFFDATVGAIFYFNFPIVHC